LKKSNFKIWTITDGSEGMISQVLGLAREFGNDISQIETKLFFPWSDLQPSFLPIFSWIFKNKIPTLDESNIIISCGRKSVYLSLYLKNKYKNIINIHIQNPKVSFKNFNYIIIPNHDGVKGNNIINSTGALHKFSPEKISKTEKIDDLGTNNLLSCFIGGQNQHYHFNDKQAEDLCVKLKNLKKNNPQINLLILTSRRTDFAIKKILKKKLSKISTLWLGQGKNPYQFALRYSNYFIVTSDSTSMISESAVSGKPIYIYNLPFKRVSDRLEKFHNEFKNLNIIRDFKDSNTLENWSYNPLNESKRISGIIKERIIEDQ